jgi:hypothetical protein
VCEDCEIPHFIRREGKDTAEAAAAFSALESHFQDTLKSNRFSLGCETRFQRKPESNPFRQADYSSATPLYEADKDKQA